MPLTLKMQIDRGSNGWLLGLSYRREWERKIQSLERVVVGHGVVPDKGKVMVTGFQESID